MAAPPNIVPCDHCVESAQVRLSYGGPSYGAIISYACSTPAHLELAKLKLRRDVALDVDARTVVVQHAFGFQK